MVCSENITRTNISKEDIILFKNVIVKIDKFLRLNISMVVLIADNRAFKLKKTNPMNDISGISNFPFVDGSIYLQRIKNTMKKENC